MTLTIGLKIVIDADGKVHLVPLGWTARTDSGKWPGVDELSALLRAVAAQADSRIPLPVDFEARPVPTQLPQQSMNRPIAPLGTATLNATQTLSNFGFSRDEVEELTAANTLDRINEVITWVRAKPDAKNPVALARSLLRK